MVFPLVEESEKSDAKAAVEEHARLQSEFFPNLRLGLLHGRMRSEEKDEIMTAFRDGSFDILVSTSVIEVGVDVPNATVMVIEGANRFGLAQLHQFRGRVGRGSEKSYCILIPDQPDAAENERLQAMVDTNDGFVLAERDLEQRGPGQFLGTRQSGFTELKVANLTDVRLIEKARHYAVVVFEQDPDYSCQKTSFSRLPCSVPGEKHKEISANRMVRAVFPGTFDPIHYGHIDIAQRAARLFDELVIAVYDKPLKSLVFPPRCPHRPCNQSLDSNPKISVMGYSGLTVSFCQSIDAHVIVRGLRVFSDFEFEFRMALANHRLAEDIDVIALITAEEHTFLPPPLSGKLPHWAAMSAALCRRMWKKHCGRVSKNLEMDSKSSRPPHCGIDEIEICG